MTGRTGRDEGTDALKARLDAYARARLEPDPAARSRIRAHVMAEARTRLGAGRDRRSGWLARVLGGRPVLAFVGAALSMALLAGGAMAGSQAGGPLYGARIWLEEITLPTEANARAEAELARLQTRLDEAAAAAAAGNGGAVSAALAEYRQIVDDVVADAGGDVERDARIQLALGTHQVVLETLAGLLPEQASDAVQKAMDKSHRAVEAIEQKGKPSQAQPGGAPASPGPKASPGPPESPGPPATSRPQSQRTPPAGPPSEPPGRGRSAP